MNLTINRAAAAFAERGCMLSKSDASLVARDPSVSGMKLLLDDAALLAELVEHLPQLKLVGAHTEYLRYKPGVSCLARIRLQTPLEESSAYAVAYEPHAHSKLLKAAKLCDDAKTSPIWLRNESIVVYPFPLDRRLPALQYFASESSLRELLRRAAPGLAEQPDIQFTPLRYKPERRFVAQLAVSGRPAAALKLYSAAAYHHARRAAKTIGGMAGMSHAKCIGHSDRHATMLFDWIEGAPLSDIATHANQASEAFGHAARTLRSLHARHTSKLPTDSHSTALSCLRNSAAVLTWIAQELADEVQVTCDLIADRLVKTREHPPVPIHGDLHLKQFVVSANGPQLIDFDRARLADSAEDLGNLYANLRRRSINSSGGEEYFDGLFQHLLHEYAAAGGEVELDRIQVYAAFRLIQVAVEPFRTRHPDWITQTRRFLEAAQQLLGNCPNRHFIISNRAITRRPSEAIEVENPFNIVADEYLPLVRDAIDPRSAAERLGELACFEGRHTGIELKRIRVLRHKPGRRCLIEYAGRSRATGESISLMGKMAAKKRHDLHFARQQTLWNVGFQSDSLDGVSVPRPWNVIPEWHMWLQEKVSGETAWRALQGSIGPGVAKQIAYALSKLHSANLTAASVHTMDDEMMILRDRLLLAAEGVPVLADRIRGLLEACQRIAAEHVPGDPCPVHRDFYPDQILVDGDRLVLVDFDLFCHGEAAVDVGNFRAHLFEHSLRCPGHTAAYAKCDAALISEYVKWCPFVTAASIDAYTVLSIARHLFLCMTRSRPYSVMLRVLEACERYVKVGGFVGQAKHAVAAFPTSCMVGPLR